MDVLDRIKLVVKQLVLGGVAENQRAVGALLGYRNESSFSQILNGKVHLPGDFITRLASLDPALDPLWIEKGEGSIYRSKLSPASGKVPLLPILSRAGALDDFLQEYSISGECEMVVSPVAGVDFAVSLPGDSMLPSIPADSVLFVKKINEKAFIEWGASISWIL